MTTLLVEPCECDSPSPASVSATCSDARESGPTREEGANPRRARRRLDILSGRRGRCQGARARPPNTCLVGGLCSRTCQAIDNYQIQTPPERKCFVARTCTCLTASHLSSQTRGTIVSDRDDPDPRFATFTLDGWNVLLGGDLYSLGEIVGSIFLHEHNMFKKFEKN